MTTATVIAELPKNAREKVRVALDEYRGVNLIDVRVLTELSDGSGVMVPTKKGVSMKIERLPALIEALQDAEAEARRRGLIGAPTQEPACVDRKPAP